VIISVRLTSVKDSTFYTLPLTIPPPSSRGSLS
jgi:hypothetical protein